MRTISILFLVLIICISGCKSSQKQITQGEVQSKNTLVEINADPSGFIGKEIEIIGKYLGYNASTCKFEENFCKRSPETRSDWVFSHSGSCTYVSGGKPSELSGLEVPDSVLILKLKAKVVQNPDKKVYLKYISAQIIPLP